MHYSAPRLTSAEVRTANPLGVNEMLRASRNKDVPGRSHDQPGTPCGLSVHRVNADHGLGSCIDLIDLPSVRAKIRSEEHTSELQSLMRISYAVFCLKKTKNTDKHPHSVKNSRLT